MTAKRLSNLAFGLFLIVVLAVATWEAHGWARETRLFPYAVGRFALALTVIVFLQDLWKLRKERQEEGPPEHALGEEEDAFDENSPAFIARALTEFAWIAGFGLTLWITGFYAAVFLFLFAYLWRRARVSFLGSLLWGAGVCTVVVLVFGELLSMQSYDGLLGPVVKGLLK